MKSPDCDSSWLLKLFVEVLFHKSVFFSHYLWLPSSVSIPTLVLSCYSVFVSIWFLVKIFPLFLNFFFTKLTNLSYSWSLSNDLYQSFSSDHLYLHWPKYLIESKLVADVWLVGTVHAVCVMVRRVQSPLIFSLSSGSSFVILDLLRILSESIP